MSKAYNAASFREHQQRANEEQRRQQNRPVMRWNPANRHYEVFKFFEVKEYLKSLGFRWDPGKSGSPKNQRLKLKPSSMLIRRPASS